MKLFTSCLLSGLLLLSWNSLNAQNCEVALEGIRGTYEGDCKKGKAHGQCKSIGKDTYTGEFRKGLPSGMGTYTYANGNVFVGQFNRGMMDGQGELTILRLGEADSVVTGYWADNEYIGKDPNKYEVKSKSPEIVSLQLDRTGDLDQLQIMFTIRGQPTAVEGLNVQGIYGPGVLQGRSTIYNNIEFPWEGAVRFTYRDQTRTRGALVKNCEIVLKINQPGTWKIRVDLRDED